MINSKNNTQKKIKYELKKFINIPIIQVSFLHILKISATKSIKISNAEMQNVLNCQITCTRWLPAKLFTIFQIFEK